MVFIWFNNNLILEKWQLQTDGDKEQLIVPIIGEKAKTMLQIVGAKFTMQVQAVTQT